jgi:hypothetical protein
MEALFSQKRRFLQEPYGVTSQKTAIYEGHIGYDMLVSDEF